MNKVSAILLRHWQPLLGLNLILFAATGAAIVSSPRVWTAKTQVILPNTTSNLDADLGPLGTIKNGETEFSTQVNPLNIQASIITSDELTKRLWSSDPEKEQYASLGQYKSLFKVSPHEQSTIIELEVNGSSRDLAFNRATTLIKLYQQRLNELRQDDTTTREEFSHAALERARQNLARTQSDLSKFQRASGLVNSEEQTKGLVSIIGTLTDAQAQAAAQAQSNDSLSRKLSTRLGMTPDQSIRSLSLGENKDYQFTREKLSEVEATLVENQARFTDQHESVQALLVERDQLRRQLQKHIDKVAAPQGGVDTTVSSDAEGRSALIQRQILAESEGTQQQRQAAQLQSRLDQLNGDLESIPIRQERLQELQRRYDIAEGVFKGLVAQVNKAQVNAFDVYPSVQVLDAPVVNHAPSKAKLTAIAGLLAAVFSSVALALLLEARNPLLSAKDLQEIEFPVVVQIPRFKGLGADMEVAFQCLGSAISLLTLANRRLLITSSTVGEGKTTVTLGLAAALVDLGFRVLVVDGDFRRAELSRQLGYGHTGSTGQEPVQVRSGFDVLPTSPRQGKVVNLVARGRFEQHLAAVQASGNYDYVLVDSAPVSLTSETALMIAATQNVLFVVRPGSSDRNSVKASLQQLAQHKAEIVALAINSVDMSADTYRYQREGSPVNV